MNHQLLVRSPARRLGFQCGFRAVACMFAVGGTEGRVGAADRVLARIRVRVLMAVRVAVWGPRRIVAAMALGKGVV